MAKVLFKRLDENEDTNNVDIQDGSILITKQGQMYIDYDDKRVSVGGTPDTEMSDKSSNPVENKVVKAYVDDKTSILSDVFVEIEIDE